MTFKYNSQIYNNTSSNILVPEIIQIVKPMSIVDIGCGTGNWLFSFQENGISDILGIDGSEYDDNLMLIPISQYLQSDLGAEFKLKRKYDLAICLEVAEHLDHLKSDVLVKTLVDLSPIILFSAAIPGQGGDGHINEQWVEYWSDKFKDYGYNCFDLLRPKIWSDKRIHFWYRQNILLFSRHDSINGCMPTEAPMSIVHPEHYLNQEKHLKSIHYILNQKNQSLFHKAKSKLNFIFSK